MEVAGTAKVNNSADLKEKLWDPKLERWFDGKDDPNLVILEIEPKQIKLMNAGEKRRPSWNFNKSFDHSGAICYT